MATSVTTGRTSRPSSRSTRSRRRRSRSSARPTAPCWPGTPDGRRRNLLGRSHARALPRPHPARLRGGRARGRAGPGALERMVWVPTSYHPDPAEALAAARLEAGVWPATRSRTSSTPVDGGARQGCRRDDDSRRLLRREHGRGDRGDVPALPGAGATHVIWGDLSPGPISSPTRPGGRHPASREQLPAATADARYIL